MMSKRITLDLPDSVYEHALQVAAKEGFTIEAVLIEALSEFCQETDGDSQRKALIAAAIEATDWWDTKGDREWDCWRPQSVEFQLAK